MNELVICRHRPGAGETVTTVLTIGQDGTVTDTDPNISLVLGYSSSDLEGRPLKQLIASAEDNPLSPDYATYHETGRPLTVTLRHSRGYFMAARVIVRKASAEQGYPRIRSSDTPSVPEKAPARQAVEASDRENIAQTKAMLVHIRECLSQGDLPLEFQPIESLNTKAGGLAFEVLARLPGAQGSDAAMTPPDFLPLTERFELSRRLDRQVIKQTLCHIYRHPRLSETLSYCGFNLSLGSLQDRSFPGFIGRCLEKTGLKPESLCFEIPAHHAVAYTADCRQTCRMLRRLGCKTALDGAGNSMDSYRLAGRLPVDYIKLAPELMQGLRDEPTHLVMMEALQRIANATGKISIATNVENDIVRQRLQNMGIHLFQGRLVSLPLPLQDLGNTDQNTRSAGAIA